MEEKAPVPKPEETPKEPLFPSRRKRLFSSADLRASAIGWEIAIPIVSGPLIGFLIDRRFNTDVRWTMICMGIGLLAATYSVVKYINHEMHKMNVELEKKKAELEKLKQRIKK